MNALVHAQGLTKNFPAPRSIRDVMTGHRPAVSAVAGIDLQIHRGESVGLLGESGCGKTTIGRMLLGLVKIKLGK